MSKSNPSIRRLPLVVAVVGVLFVGAWYRFFFEQQLAYVHARNARLVAVPVNALSGSVRGGDLQRHFTREGSVLSVDVQARNDAGRWQEATTFTFKLRDLLEQMPLGSEAFDLRLVANDRGDVLERVGNVSVVRSLADLPSGAPGSGLEAARLWRASHTAAVRVNGREYEMFCHPLALPGGLNVSERGKTMAAEQGLVFCGLASAGRLRRQALTLSPLVVAAGVGLLVLALLMPALLKPFLLGPSERLRLRDVQALVACTLAAVFMLTVATLDLFLFASLKGYADDGLRVIAGEVRAHLTDELLRLREQLAVLDGHRAEGDARGPCVNILALGAQPPQGCPPLPPETSRLYPYFESAAWATMDGKQTARWSTAAVPPLEDVRKRMRLPLSQREYFKAARDGELWVFPNYPDRPLYVEVVKSFARGKLRTVLAVRSADEGTPRVATITTTLLSTTDPVLPRNVAFAVVEQDGDVVFHSDARQALAHNLFTETGESPDLRAAVAAGRDHASWEQYWGERHHFQTAPVEHTPWTVVAFRKTAPLGAVNVEILENAALLALVYGAGSGALALLLSAWWGKRLLRHVVPIDAARFRYAEAAAVLAAALGLFVVLIRDATPARAFALALGLPWAAVLMMGLSFRVSLLERIVCGLPERLRCRIDGALRAHCRGFHLTAALLACLLLAAVPALAVMKAGADLGVETLARSERQWRADRMQARTRAIRTFYDASLRCDTDAQLLGHRYAETSDLYSGGLFVPGAPTPGDSPCNRGHVEPGAVSGEEGWLAAWLRDVHEHKPLLDPEAAVLRHLRVPGSEAAARPSFWRLLGTHAGAGGLILAFLLGAWIRSSSRVLMVDAWSSHAYILDEVKTSVASHTLYLAPSGFEADRLLEGQWYERLRLPGDGERSLIRDDSSRPLLVDLRGFEAAETRARTGLLEMLEWRVERGEQRVCLLLCVHPMSLLLNGQAPGNGRAADWAQGEADRWIRLFDRLKPVVVRERRSTPREGAGRDEGHAARLLGATATPSRTARLARELASTPRLTWLAENRLPAGAFAGLSHADIVARLADAAAPYYRALWNACSLEERLTLVHLCEESVLNPKRAGSARQLLDRGVVVRDPILRPMNESFALFVRSIEGREGISKAEQVEGGRAWSGFQLPVVTVGMAFGLLLFLLRQDALDTVVPAISAVGGTAATLILKVATDRLKGLVGGGSGGGQAA